MKNQKMSQCNILAVSGGYLDRLTSPCTALYHSSMLLLIWQKLINKSKWALTSFDCGLQNSSNLPHIVSKYNSCFGQVPGHVLVHPKVPTPGYNFLALLLLWEGCKLTFKNVLTFSISISESSDIAHHLLSNLFLGLQYRA